MRPARIATALAVSVVTVAFVHPDSGLLKCGPFPPGMDRALFAVDGIITDADPQSVDPSDIYAVEIVCLNPDDSTFNQDRGIGVVSVWTMDGPAPERKPALDAILAAQTAHFKERSAYIGSLDAIDLSEYSPQLQLSMEVSPEGWSAAAGVERLISRCFVYDGEIKSPHSEVSPGEPKCLDRRALRSPM